MKREDVEVLAFQLQTKPLGALGEIYASSMTTYNAGIEALKEGDTAMLREVLDCMHKHVEHLATLCYSQQ